MVFPQPTQKQNWLIRESVMESNQSADHVSTEESPASTKPVKTNESEFNCCLAVFPE